MQLTMPYRRMSGLTEAHFDETAIRTPALIATLPYDQNRVARYATDRVLLRTLERWSWFADAQKRSPALGTLSYLPPEVRSVVWKALLDYRGALSTDGMWEYDKDLGSPFHLSAYYFGFGRGRRHEMDGFAMGLRLTSSAAKFAFEDALLSMHTFRFNYPENLGSFFFRLQGATKARVFAIDIGICLLYEMEPWKEPISKLPAGLMHIRFLLYPSHIKPQVEAKIRQSLEYLEKLVEAATQSASRARISIASTTQGRLQPEFRVATDEIMQRLREKKARSTDKTA